MEIGLRSSTLVVSSAALLAVLGCTGGVPTPTSSAAAAPAHVSAAASKAVPDFDGDGKADLVFGVGSTQSRVVVSYGSGTQQSFERTDVGGRPQPADSSMGFGQGLLARDLNKDGFTDLVVVDTTQGGDGSAIYLVPGSSTGLTLGSAARVGLPKGVTAFRGTPALVESPSRLLVVSVVAPSSVAKGGALAAFRLGSDGLPTSKPTILSQKNLPGTDETGDGFGTVVAASGSTLLIGAPLENVGTVRDAGAVTVLRYKGSASFTGSVVTQSTKGVAGSPSKGDQFGAALAIVDGYAAVGIPFEDTTARDSGSVATFKVGSGTLKPVATITQSTKGVPGVAETGDRFGTSVAVVRGCKAKPALLVGAPNEVMGTAVQSGSTWLIPLTGACAAKQLAEGGALGGVPTEMALIGRAVSAIRTASNTPDTLVMTAPGISEEGVLGRVLTLASPYAGPATAAASALQLNEEGTIALSPIG